MRLACAFPDVFKCLGARAKKLETKATLKMNAEGLKKLIFANIHFNMKLKLEKDTERERKKPISSSKSHRKNMSATTVMGRKRSDQLRTELPLERHTRCFICVYNIEEESDGHAL